jgi:hypothetical protein
MTVSAPDLRRSNRLPGRRYANSGRTRLWIGRTSGHGSGLLVDRPQGRKDSEANAHIRHYHARSGRFARMVAGVVDLLTDPRTPTTCMWVHGALSCGDDPLRKEFAAQRVAGFEELRARFRRAVTEGDLPINADVDTLANFVQTVNFGCTVSGVHRCHPHGSVVRGCSRSSSLAEVKLPRKYTIFQGGAKTEPDCCSHEKTQCERTKIPAPIYRWLNWSTNRCNTGHVEF